MVWQHCDDQIVDFSILLQVLHGGVWRFVTRFSVAHANSMVRDADGDYVMLQFAADEATSTLMDEVAAFDHPVMVSTIFDRGVLSWVLGGPLEGTGPTAPNPIPVDEKLTVGDLASAILDAQAIGAALEFVLVRTGHARMLVSG